MGTMSHHDSVRLDFLEREIRAAAERGERACVVLAAWYSQPGPTPDGYSFNSGEYEPDAQEFPTLRDAIDDAMEREGQ
jgi:hypothetical protein